ncbi:MAG: phytanoyl-CoA dioxygenase family protein [Actinomycetota bacterium]
MTKSTKGGTAAAERRDRFAEDGVVKVEGAVDAVTIDRLLDVADQELATPGAWVTDTNPGAVTDRLFTTRYLWPHNDTVRGAALDSGIAAVVGEVLGAGSLRFYFDHTLVKEPFTEAPTPWHQDIPYWPFLGRQIASAWVALTEATVEQSGLEFIRGSHLWNAYYSPVSFTPRAERSTADWTSEFVGEEMPDIDADRDAHDIISFDVEPGDAIVFSAWIIHGAPGNAGTTRRVAFSTRWLGDDATWAPHPGSDPTISADEVDVEPGSYPDDDRHFPLAWSRP